MVDDDDREFYRAWKQASRDRKRELGKKNMDRANSEDKGWWTKHRPDHWTTTIAGHGTLDYWPTKNKFRHRGKTMYGNVNDYIQKRINLRAIGEMGTKNG